MRLNEYIVEDVTLEWFAGAGLFHRARATIKRYLQVRLAGSRQVVRGVSAVRGSPKP